MAACPQCGKSTRLDAQNPWRPFCSERCRLIDLGAWFSGERRIADEAPVDPSAPAPQSDQ
ncbi:DNA gyrase inhibitor YacG [Fontimonas sp. SYSU GA230001]|uniref:DNA gyrase inhibitor YacG n=1 Tax=Fontimonas sp. SYSU GA230001 TaxID=3142450 RepID=UPI0032B45135